MNVGEELLERAMQHRPTPHHRLVPVEEEADRHELELVLDRRDDHPIDEDGLLVDTKDVRNRMSVNVRVEDSRTLTEAS